MRITIEEIANIAGVSKTTVSRVINNKPDVSDETRGRIHKIIEERGFHPNIFARCISSQRINHIGLIIPYSVEYVFSNQFYVDVLRGISNEVERSGYYLLLCYVTERNYVEIYQQKRVDGFVLLSPGSLHHSIIRELQSENIPFISTAKLLNEPDLIYVDVDNIKGAKTAVNHLISLGHKEIGYIGKPALTSSHDRLIGYKEALLENNISIKDEYIKITDSSSIQNGHDVVLELVGESNYPTAIFLANDIMAIGAIKAIQELGKNVPDDISIVGFDDILLSQFTSPALTTVRQPASQKGAEAVRLLIDYIENGTEPSIKLLNTELILRESTSPR